MSGTEFLVVVFGLLIGYWTVSRFGSQKPTFRKTAFSFLPATYSVDRDVRGCFWAARGVIGKSEFPVAAMLGALCFWYRA